MAQLQLGAGVVTGPPSNFYKTGLLGNLGLRYRFEKPIALEANFGYLNTQLDAGDRDGRLTQLPIGLGVQYFFLHTTEYRPYVGLESGCTFLAVEQGLDARSSTNFSAGVYVGGFFLVSPALALDLRVSYRHIPSSFFGRYDNMGTLGIQAGVVLPF
jgi:outer membrane protein W